MIGIGGGRSHAWVTPAELSALAARDSFVPDAREALDRYRALNSA
ncbi:hypothetical protein EDD90_6122 [Streptomyces sp. Ag109_O5-1]|nr:MULTISPECIES: hypothetical protein [Streptomyces]RPE42954.1 hypothetical protein EDD90_6122 [Streptomyces sp. Ag109_O5-1]